MTTKAFDSSQMQKVFDDMVGNAPEALDTLAELADALNNNADFATSVATALASKSDVTHGHVISDISSLQTALDDKAASSHGHAISDVSGLQTALDTKVNSAALGDIALSSVTVSTGNPTGGSDGDLWFKID